MRECGLKSVVGFVLVVGALVTPLAGVWVEISAQAAERFSTAVTPLAGVWVEIGWY